MKIDGMDESVVRMFIFGCLATWCASEWDRVEKDSCTNQDVPWFHL